MESILGYIETGSLGRTFGGWRQGLAVTDEGGYFIEPTVIADVAPDAAIAQQEIFGPVLAIIKVGEL